MAFPADSLPPAPETSRPVVARRRSVARILVALFAVMAGLMTGDAFATHRLAGDSWWSWAVGRWELTHHQWATFNMLQNGPGLTRAPWTNLEWGWQALLALAGGTGHWPATSVLIVFGALAATCAWIGLALGLRLIAGRWDWGQLVWAVLPAGFFWLPFYATLRPQVLSGLFWMALLLILWQAQKTPRWLWAAVPLALLWSPFHGDWVLVPVLVAVDAGWQALTRKPGARQRLLVALAALAVPAVLNPFGLREVAYIVWLDQNPWIRMIVEWQPPNFQHTQFQVWLAAWALGVGLAIWRTHQEPGRIPGRLWLWLGGTLVMTLMERRMALYLAPVFAWTVALAVPTGSLPWRPQWKHLAWLAPLLVGGWFLGFSLSPGRWARPLTPITTWAAQHPTPGLTLVDPVDAGEWEATAPRAAGPVFTDGRADFYLKQAPGRIPWEYRFFDVGVSPQSFAQQDITRIVWRKNMSTWPLPAIRSLREAGWHPVVTRSVWTVWEPAQTAAGTVVPPAQGPGAVQTDRWNPDPQPANA